MTEIKKLPLEYKLLKMIAKYIDDYFVGIEHPKVARANEFYDFLSRKDDFKKYLSDSTQFSRFLRDMHKKGLMKQFIVNYDVDTSLHYHYKWYFYPRGKALLTNTQETNCMNAKAHAGTNNYKSKQKIYETVNGVMVRSMQEQHIMNRLLSQSDFEVYYERQLIAGEQERYPDFTVHNIKTDTVFYWEHFGLSENTRYVEEMAEKIEWYQRIEIKNIEDGGRFIATIFINESHFIKLVDDLIEKMKDIIIPIGFLRG
jgi:hypothetical protein